MDDRFFTACFPGEATVCGRSLQAFTPYHYLLLKALQSPFLAADGVNRPADLLAAVAACRNQFGKLVKIKPTFRDLLWRIRMDANPGLFREEAIKFSRWMTEHSSGPRFWEIIQGGPATRDLTGPDILTLVVPLLMKTGMSEADIWNMSLGRAQWINAEIQEIEGSERKFYFEDGTTEDDLTEEENDNA